MYSITIVTFSMIQVSNRRPAISGAARCFPVVMLPNITFEDVLPYDLSRPCDDELDVHKAEWLRSQLCPATTDVHKCTFIVSHDCTNSAMGTVRPIRRQTDLNPNLNHDHNRIIYLDVGYELFIRLIQQIVPAPIAYQRALRCH